MEYFSQEAIDRVNQECYEHCADTWDRFPLPQSLPSFIQKYYQPVLGKNVLDVGSGTGVLAKWLADQGFDVLCLDPSLEMTRRCKEKGLQMQTFSIQAFNIEFY